MEHLASHGCLMSSVDWPKLPSMLGVTVSQSVRAGVHGKNIAAHPSIGVSVTHEEITRLSGRVVLPALGVPVDLIGGCYGQDVIKAHKIT